MSAPSPYQITRTPDSAMIRDLTRLASGDRIKPNSIAARVLAGHRNQKRAARISADRRRAALWALPMIETADTKTIPYVPAVHDDSDEVLRTVGRGTRRRAVVRTYKLDSSELLADVTDVNSTAGIERYAAILHEEFGVHSRDSFRVARMTLVG